MRGRALRVIAALAGAVALAVPVSALPPAIDGDGDGYLDGIETRLGSNAADAGSTPESVANPPSCFNGLDDDADAASDIDDPGCLVPVAVEDAFPPAGADVFDSHMTLQGYQLATPFGTCSVDFDAHGPTVVERGTPVDLGGGLREIDVEIVAMQLSGTATVNPGGDCTLPPGDVDVTVYESPAQATLGKVTDTNPDPTLDFPAASFFDVFFEIDVSGTILVGGPPGGPAGQPIRVANTVASLPPYHTAKNPNCYEVQGLAHEHCPKAPPDHYKCYTAKFPKLEKRSVTLRDQFGQAEAKVLKPRLFCTPTTKGAEPLYDEASHLTCYAVKPVKAKNIVVVHNQLGTGDVTTKKRTMLCLPTEKNGEGDPLEVDHFACYSGKFPKIEPRPVALVDQFKTEENKASKALVLCNPVSKNGEPIRNPLEHLVCYRLKPEPESRTVTFANQFQTGEVRIKKSAALCVPTGKFGEGATTTTTTPGATTTTTLAGRAFTSVQQIGVLAAGSTICLEDVQGGCVAQADACPGLHLHGVVSVFDGTTTVGPLQDPNPPQCGHGQIVTEPGCGPDDVPACGG